MSDRAKGAAPFCLTEFVTPKDSGRLAEACVDGYIMLIKGEYLVKNTTDIRIDVIFYD